MQFAIQPDHPSLPGHFPGNPVVPGVVVLDRVIEAIEARHGPLGACRMPQVKFMQPLLPGEVADIALECDGDRVRFRVTRDGTPIASGELVRA
jgi:3-hydroxymyristoyl/3-hydroxydecanoyl-(acyl carrier protein) dehydratase